MESPPPKPTRFQYLIILEPLGLLYGSAGRFLSPDNLVGRSGQSFPPSAATLSGLFAARYGPTSKKSNSNKLQETSEQSDLEKLQDLTLAGPFWAQVDDPDNFYVPLPLTELVKNGQIIQHRTWGISEDSQAANQADHQAREWSSPSGKFEDGYWVAINHWESLAEIDPKQQSERDQEQASEGDPEPEPKGDPKKQPKFSPIAKAPWECLPHLHPRLKDDERRVDTESDRGSLFLENAVQLKSGACLVYLSSQQIAEGWYRFGGEGHLVDVQCRPLEPDSSAGKLLTKPLGRCFATITPAIWGSNRLSYRQPMLFEPGPDPKPAWNCETMLCSRATPYRYRLGRNGDADKGASPASSSASRLSRGRYAVPAGAVYVLSEGETQEQWEQWDEAWFPREGYSFKRWGCGLALPLKSERVLRDRPPQSDSK